MGNNCSDHENAEHSCLQMITVMGVDVVTDVKQLWGLLPGKEVVGQLLCSGKWSLVTTIGEMRFSAVLEELADCCTCY